MKRFLQQPRKTIRSRRQAWVAWSLCALALTGCQLSAPLSQQVTLRPGQIGANEAPGGGSVPAAASAQLSQSPSASKNSSANVSSANQPNNSATNNSSSSVPSGMIVRGQDGYALPPSSTLPPSSAPAIGSDRLTRGPMPGVNMQPQYVAQNTGNQTNGDIPLGPPVNGVQPSSGVPQNNQGRLPAPVPSLSQPPLTNYPSTTANMQPPPNTYQPAPTYPSAPAPVYPQTTYPPNAQPYVPTPYQQTAPGQVGAPNVLPPSTIGTTAPSIEAVPNFNPSFNNSFPPEEPLNIGPPLREVPVDVSLNGARTGRFMVGGAVNSDAGVTGQIVLDERNFDILQFPRSFSDIISGRAWRGAGQTFRLEAVPGNQFQRYTVSFGEPYLFGYLPLSFNINGFYFDRRYQDWDETRIGGRASLGYRVTPDLTLEVGGRAENVDFKNPRVIGIPEIDALVGDHDLYGGNVRLTHDTRDIPFAPTQGHLLQLEYEQVFGSFDYPRFNGRFQHFLLLRQRPDQSGRHTLSFTYDVGISGKNTPIFENYFMGGYSTLRGFSFRGAGPEIATVQTGGRFRFLGSAEYQFPLTADDMFKGVAFLDYGIVERDIEFNSENLRVVPGFGFRLNIPAMGPAPLAFDFGFPIAYQNTDDRQVFSFFVGFNR